MHSATASVNSLKRRGSHSDPRLTRASVEIVFFFGFGSKAHFSNCCGRFICRAHKATKRTANLFLETCPPAHRGTPPCSVHITFRSLPPNTLERRRFPHCPCGRKAFKALMSHDQPVLVGFSFVAFAIPGSSLPWRVSSTSSSGHRTGIICTH